MTNHQLLDFLYTKNQIVHIDYSKAKSDAGDTELIDQLAKFSKENNINISQYNFLSENDLNVYSTNTKNDPNIHLESGEIPKGITYIANKDLDSNGTKQSNQSGIFSFPLSSWKIRIYDIQQVKNVGLGNEFYLSGANHETINAFTQEFSSYGNISLINENINSLGLTNMPLLMIVAFSFVIFFLGMFYFLIHNRKNLLLQELWGYSNRLIFSSIPRLFLRFSIIMISLLLVGMGIFILLLDQSYFLLDYIIMFTLTNGIAIFILLLFTLLEIWIVQKFNHSSLHIKGKLPFEKMTFISSILKIVISIILFSIISSSLVNFYHLRNKVASLDYWDQTQNVFRIQVRSLDEDINDNLKKDRDLNDREAMYLKRHTLGYVFQNYVLMDNETVYKNLLISKAYNDDFNKEMLINTLEAVGLDSTFLNKKVYQLSGGEQQRVAIARVMLKPCEIILADEPTGNLDSLNKKVIVSLFRQLQNLGKTIVCVTHDKEIANKSDRIIKIDKVGLRL